MPIKYGKNSNFKGKKGRSGRWIKYNEETKHQAIKKAWEITLNEMDRSSALPIALKDMTEKTDVTSDGKELKGLTNEQRSQIAKRLLGGGLTDVESGQG